MLSSSTTDERGAESRGVFHADGEFAFEGVHWGCEPGGFFYLSMITAAKRELKAVRAGAEGTRFRDRFDSRPPPSAAARAGLVLAGITSIIAGIVMLVIPGPGLVGVLLGIALLAAVFRPFASLFDALERVGRKLWMKLPASWRASRLVKASFVIAIALGAMAAGLTSYLLLNHYVG